VADYEEHGLTAIRTARENALARELARLQLELIVAEGTSVDRGGKNSKGGHHANYS
jgi:hypothetical protein